MRPLLPLLALLLLTAPAAAAPLAPGAALPRLRGELLSGTGAELPGLTRGRAALIAFGFTRGSSRDVEAWVGRFRAFYGGDPAFTWLEVPLMTGRLARMMKPLIESGMRGGTPVPDRAHVMTAWSVAPEWKDRLAFDAPDSAYLVLLDRDGRVRWRGAGPLDDTRWQELAAASDALR